MTADCTLGVHVPYTSGVCVCAFCLDVSSGPGGGVTVSCLIGGAGGGGIMKVFGLNASSAHVFSGGHPHFAACWLMTYACFRAGTALHMRTPPPLWHGRLELEATLNQQQHERAQANSMRRQDWEWQRFLSCTHVPHPKDRVAVNDFTHIHSSIRDEELESTLQGCQVRRGAGGGGDCCRARRGWGIGFVVSGLPGHRSGGSGVRVMWRDY